MSVACVCAYTHPLSVCPCVCQCVSVPVCVLPGRRSRATVCVYARVFYAHFGATGTSETKEVHTHTHARTTAGTSEC